MDADKIINSYQSVFGKKQPTSESVGRQREETLDKIANVSTLKSLMESIRLAYDLISDSVKGNYKGVSKGTIALLVGGLAYLALPIDLVPDFIPVAGWLDDGVVLTWIFAQCADEFKKYKAFKGE